MFKKIQYAIFISCMASSSYAYVVPSNLSIDNQTDAILEVVIDQPKGQDQIKKPLPAHELTQIAMDNGDHGGLLYQTSSATLTIKAPGDNGNVYVKGRVGYYVGGSLNSKYSFLNAVTAAEGLTVDTNYSCQNGGYNHTFDNKMIITGTPDKALTETKFPETVSCNGIKSSTISDKNQEYVVTCSDDSNSLFHQRYRRICDHHGINCWWDLSYSNGEKILHPEFTDDMNNLQSQLNALAGKKICGTW